MPHVPAKTRVAILDWDDTVNEIVEFDHTYDLIRECKKMLHNFPPEVTIGWKYVNARWIPPETKGGE